MVRRMLEERPLVEQIHDAFLLGASAAELTARIQLATSGSVTGDDAMWTASMWRVNFKRLTQLHAGFFPDSDAGHTLFDANEELPDYLVPLRTAPNDLDYADVGIPKHEGTGATLPDAFTLGEATRRALNCLALACVDIDTSLAPDIVGKQQARLVSAIVDATSPDPAGADSSAQLSSVRSKIMARVLAYLRFWDGYLRERFFAAGVYADDQTRLIAFEAGSSMAKLSWGLSVSILPHPEVTTAQLADIWTSAFNDRDVSRLQHQLAVVGKAIDDASAVGATTSVAARDESGRPLQTVKQSLEYWQRTVQWLTNPALNTAVEMTQTRWERLRLALVEQASIWEALVLGQEDLGAYKAEALVQRFLQEVVASFEDIAARQGLLTAVDQVGRQTDEIRGIFARQLRFLTLSIWPLLIVVGLLGVVAFGALVLRLTQQQPVGAPDVGALVLGVLGGLGLLGVHRSVGLAAGAASAPAAATPAAAPTPVAVSTPVGLADRLGAVVGQAKDTFIAAFERGFKGIQDDLADLSAAVAVTYPLVEYFVLDPTVKTIQAEYDFMVQVVWNNTDRQEEVMRVAYAAFGPLGTFAMASQLKDPAPTAKLASA